MDLCYHFIFMVFLDHLGPQIVFLREKRCLDRKKRCRMTSWPSVLVQVAVAACPLLLFQAQSCAITVVKELPLRVVRVDVILKRLDLAKSLTSPSRSAQHTSEAVSSGVRFCKKSLRHSEPFFEEHAFLVAAKASPLITARANAFLRERLADVHL